MTVLSQHLFKVPKKIRPRTQKPPLDALMCLKPHLMEARHDPAHSLYHHVNAMPDWDFVAAQQELAAQLEPLIDFFESDKNIQVSRIRHENSHSS